MVIMRTLLFWLLICSTAFAVEGEVYVGQYFNNTARGNPDGDIGKYISGVEIHESFGRFTPYIQLETIMDKYVSGGAFHPLSIRYDLGIEIDIYKGLSVDINHMCWHPIDRAGTVEQYNMLLFRYKFGN